MVSRADCTPRSLRYAIASLVVTALLIGGCATPGEKIIRIEPPPQATQTTARMLSAVLLENGYQHLGLEDPVTGHHLQTVEEFGEYRMVFAARDNSAIRVFVRVSEESGKASLRFYEENRRPLSAQAEGLFQNLVNRLTLELGRENVSVR